MTGIGATGPEGKRLTGDERTAVAQDLALLYKRGMSIRAIAADTGRKFSQVHALLHEAGVELRSRGGAHTTPRSDT